MLRKGGIAFRSKRVETKDDFLRELKLQSPDLILSDHGLPQFDGFAENSAANRNRGRSGTEPSGESAAIVVRSRKIPF